MMAMVRAISIIGAGTEDGDGLDSKILSIAVMKPSDIQPKP